MDSEEEKLVAKIKKAKNDIRKLQKRNPGKSKIQLLRRIRLELGSFAEWVVIAEIECNQEDRMSFEDRDFVRVEKEFLLKQPRAKEDCPAIAPKG